MTGDRPLLVLLIAVASALCGCDPIQTGLIHVQVTTGGERGPQPVSGASCVLSSTAEERASDAEGRLQFAGAEVGLHTIRCVLEALEEGGFGALGGVADVEVPREAGRAGLASAEVELFPIEAPLEAEADAGRRTVRVSWSPPSSSGGAQILGYVVRTLPEGPVLEVDATVREVRVSDLEDGGEYAFAIAARTLHGVGPEATTRSVVLPHVPSSPRGVKAVPGVRAVSVSWDLPEDDGGSPITAFHVTALPSGERRTVDATVTSFEFSRLMAGEEYAFMVSAENALGEGAPSKPSEVVVPTAAALERETR